LVDSVQYRRSSVFSFLRSCKPDHTSTLSQIRTIVSTPEFKPFVVLIVKTCAVALPVEEFSDILQIPNIEGHTALYWAIVNRR
ncbi:hypothetical protein DFH29DRAFT_839209, partial [Suillus ampliporus]